MQVVSPFAHCHGNSLSSTHIAAYRNVRISGCRAAA